MHLEVVPVELVIAENINYVMCSPLGVVARNLLSGNIERPHQSQMCIWRTVKSEDDLEKLIR